MRRPNCVLPTSIAVLAAVLLAVLSLPPIAFAAAETQRPDPISGTSSDGSAAADSANRTPAAEEAPLLDEAGRPYKILHLRKKEGAYYRVDSKHVRIFGGYTFEILSETADEFVVKRMLPTGERTERRPKPPASDDAAVARSYETALEENDRLRLAPFDRGLPRAGQWRNGFDLADFDGDGRLEIVFGPPRKGARRPSIFRLGADGTWSAAGAIRFPAGTWDYGDAKAADFDGDGRLDLAFGLHLLGMRALLARGADEFVDGGQGLELRDSDAASQPAFSSRAFRIADWDGDGKPDLIALGEGPGSPTMAGVAQGDAMAHASSGVAIYLNRGAGVWERRADPSGAPQRWFGDALAVGDLDRDGDPDLAIGARQMGFSSMLGMHQKDGSIRWEKLEGLRPGALVDAVTIADLDRDGWSDLVIGYRALEGIWRTGVDLFFGGANGYQRLALGAREGNDVMAAVAAGDVDGDGRLDIVAFPNAAEAWLFLARGKRVYARESTSPAELAAAEEGCSGYAARIADVDGDGRAEIVAAFAGEPNARDLFGQPLSERCRAGGSLRVWKAAQAPAD